MPALDLSDVVELLDLDAHRSGYRDAALADIALCCCCSCCCGHIYVL